MFEKNQFNDATTLLLIQKEKKKEEFRTEN
jgi:hypothetical protein